jgi:hypothetical protein
MNFNDYLNKLKLHFKDSYGLDRFSTYLLLLGLPLLLGRWTMFVGFASIAYGTWRSLSKDKYRRRLELSAFENYASILKLKVNRHLYKLKELPNFKVFKCPNCSQKLRVPRGKGKIVVTCKKCGNEFKGKC